MRMRVVHAGGKSFARSYPDSKVVENAESLASLMAPYRPKVPMTGPVAMSMQVSYPWLKGHSKKIRYMGWLPKATKPDLDNLCKAVCDVLQGAEFVANDGQIYRAEISKVHAEKLQTWIKLVEVQNE